MKNYFLIFYLFLSTLCLGQVPTYYSGIDFNQPSASIYSQLAALVTTTHSEITYSECWDALKESDLETGSTSLVALIYGYDDGDGNPVTDKTRDKNLNGGANGEWNREHVFPKSLGNPDLGTTGPGSDAHNLRASDVQQNGNRANKKFTDASGFAGTQGSDWYPGDEWKGDCARIVMYMYLRYGTRCVPTTVGTGSINATDANMANLFLDWNNDDPVSQFERDRNDAIQSWQGNRNPFIDNPRIAYKIWGGPLAEDTWGTLEVTQSSHETVKLYPMPVTEEVLYISGLNTLEVRSIHMFSVTGQLIQKIDVQELMNDGGISMDKYEQGSYILSLTFDDQTIQRKIVIE